MFKLFDKEKDIETAATPENPPEGETAFHAEKAVSIYTMPERYRQKPENSSSARQAGLVIVAGGGLVLMLAAAALYYFVIKKPAQNDAAREKAATEEQAAGTGTPGIEADNMAAKPKDTPQEAYLKVKVSIQGEDPSGAPPATAMGSVVADVNGNYALLQITSQDGSKKGVVNMTVANGEWKISSENWVTVATEETAATTTEENAADEMQPSAYKPGLDADADGLTDKEEAVLGSDPNLADSDGDGYADMAEFMNLYDPAAAGRRLADNPAIVSYSNKSFGYSLLYPSSWDVNTSNGDDSVLIKSADNQFLQIIGQPNIDSQSIEAWYMKQFSVSSIPPERLIAGVMWDAVLSDDGLIAYLTDKKHHYIFTLAYSPVQNGALDYLSFFKLAGMSFSIKE